MTRRLVLAIVGTTLAALVLAGAGTLALARANARNDSRREVTRQVTELAAALPLAGRVDAPRDRVVVLNALRRVLRLEGLATVTVQPDGSVVGELPPGLSASELDVDRLLAGEVVSGARRDLAYAAAPVPSDSGVLALVATREVDTRLGGTQGWFGLSALVTLALATAVAVLLGRRLARPVREAGAMTARVAAGELSARLPEPSPRAGDELADLARSINSMAATLERSRALEQQFLLSVSHDLRTPLASVRGYAEAIRDGAAPDPPAAAAIIQAEADRLDRLVGDLLDLARLQARTFSLHPEPADLTELVAAAVDAARPAASAAGVSLVATSPGPVRVFVDPHRLRQVVANLVDNAVRFARGTVVVTTSEDGGWATLTADDDGPGIATEDRPHVFERLYVARRLPQRRESGSGLGLAIVRELVSAMGGSVHADESPSGGARLVVRLPLQLPPP